MKISAMVVLLSITLSAFAQDNNFPYGQVTYRHLQMASYEKDTAASAVGLREFGESYINNEGNLVYTYHTVIKIFKKEGLRLADIQIPLYKEGEAERLVTFKASSYNIENGSLKETPSSNKPFSEDTKYFKIMKLAIPNVREGSVIEIQYTVESPYLFKFRDWEFQDSYPKISSDYIATIPGNYVYNITLRGFLQLTSNESKIIKDCFTPGGGNKADCSRFIFGMKDVPAFYDEPFISAKSNYISGINFELAEIKYFDGRTKKFTEEWSDAEERLRRDQSFGLQIRRGDDIMKEHLAPLVNGVDSDPLAKAKNVYSFIKDWYRWNGINSKYSESGIRKAFEAKTGNVGDINLSLVAALKYAGLECYPVILSTRSNGLPIEIHPVLTDFNYVVALVKIGDKTYFADATEDVYPFGVLPDRCINGKGRVLTDKDSYWVELKPAGSRQFIMANLKVAENGSITGDVSITYTGGEAAKRRMTIWAHESESDFFKKTYENYGAFTVADNVIENYKDVDKPLIEKFKVVAEGDANGVLLNPFFESQFRDNPLKAETRRYPIDFGVSLEYIHVISIEFPEGFEYANPREKIAISIPNNGGRFLYDSRMLGNKLSVSNSFVLSKYYYSSSEYPYLRELFNRVVQVYNEDLLFKRK